MQPLGSGDPARIGTYRVLGRLGAGGMGVVLLGRSPGGALVAIKLIRAEYAEDASFRARFRREVDIARQVRTRYAVPVVDADTETASPWLATEFVPGPSLADATAATGPLPAASVRALGAMLAEALDAVHGAGMVHRDVKPGNVLLALDGPRLIDFGIARALDDTVLTATDVVIGSPGFLSPEQAQGRPVGPASDIFSLGCVLAWAATGVRPFGTGPVEALLFRTVHDPADLATVPAELRPLIEACLAKDPARRPTAATLRATWAEDTPADGWLPPAVTHLIAERSATMLALPDIEATQADAAATRPVEPPQRPLARRRLLTYVTAGVATVATGGSTAWILMRDEKKQPPSAKPVLRLGLQADLSGPGAATGKAHEQGIRLALAEHNARKDRAFAWQLTTADDGGDPDRATEAVRRLAADDRIVAVIGATGTDAAGAALTSYDEAGLTVLSVLDGDIRHMNRVFLCARPSNAMQMYPVAQYLGLHDLDDIALIDDETEYGRQVTRLFGEGLRGTGGRTILPATIPPDAPDIDARARAVVARKPGAVVFGGEVKTAAAFARALSKTGYRGPRIASQAAHDPRFPAEAGAAADGWLLVSTATDPLAAPSARPFTRAFRTRYRTDPPSFAAEAYDATHLITTCAEALHRPNPTRHDLTPTLRKTTYKGISKPYAFEPENGGYVGSTGVFFYRIASGRFRYLGSDPGKV
ncbi:bifunctional serine/threonine-protein kinase/ABC transporter substrate-binding protein [Streptomyces sp. 15-116A]|uniref:bifunctional serine/threonine-protein kinase/ABC transporter substrate-binding protein n=1 Tax=Streptomyces sp. 15-116A TaxID=2259035 RepID=UPI0021B18D33|nr:bifunctional serine/threonine-protein kinase/ABC transporter substrate-binding protein [Streptomyces sp. 15-116A]MCT7356226.1 bifunctional serine/threonine-protein kinase/ABC transporter substrate-binding protein [Streptomyces sp. 15-116A]